MPDELRLPDSIPAAALPAESMLALTVREIQYLETLAHYWIDSGLLPDSVAKARNPTATAVIIMLIAKELGIALTTAFAEIYVISGKPTLSPKLCLAMILNSGVLENYSVTLDREAISATCTMKPKGMDAKTVTFTLEDAGRMRTTEYRNGSRVSVPLSEKANWQAMPLVMCMWRAIGACSRIAAPQVLTGFYSTEELAPDVLLDEEGSVSIPIERLREELVDNSDDLSSGAARAAFFKHWKTRGLVPADVLQLAGLGSLNEWTAGRTALDAYLEAALAVQRDDPNAARQALDALQTLNED